MYICDMERLRCMLYDAIENGNTAEILAISERLDIEIVKYTMGNSINVLEQDDIVIEKGKV
jgi:hypothetical protein